MRYGFPREVLTWPSHIEDRVKEFSNLNFRLSLQDLPQIDDNSDENSLYKIGIEKILTKCNGWVKEGS